MSPIRYDKDAESIVTLTFDAPGAPVNTMTEAWQAAFAESVARLQKEKDSIAGVILASAKKTFFAGAELKDVLKFGPDDGPQVFEWIQGVKKHMRALEKLGKPVVAAVGGTALGGGWEIALTAHCRIVLDDPRIELGLPEVTLGLLPGAGGVTKMVRLLGLQGAFPYLIEGKTLRPQEAAKLGLIQGLAANNEDLFRMAREWIRANPRRSARGTTRNTACRAGRPRARRSRRCWRSRPAMLTEKTRGLLPRPKRSCRARSKAPTSTSIPRCGSNRATSRSSRSAGREEPDHAVLQSHRDQIGRERKGPASRRRAALEGAESRRSRRGHDGRGHCRGRMPRAAFRAS
jgi:3-hydroxyacyl-CoA dehydrogenase/enoyl-CoA hydratase/3-hydroxybutyryl-CoA epimerase